MVLYKQQVDVRKLRSDSDAVEMLSGSTTPHTPTTSPPGSPPPKQTQTSIGDVVMRGLTVPVCAAEFKLSDVARLLLSTDQTAAAVVAGDGAAIGLMTEGDILQAYFQGAPWDCRVSDWLRGHGAFGDHGPVHHKGVSVRSDEALSTSVLRLLPPAPAGTHLLVEDADDLYCGVFSPLSLARAAVMYELFEVLGPTASSMTVSAIMDPRDAVPLCVPGCTMHQVLQSLLASREHAAMVANLQGVFGLLTARDGLWAFQEQIPLAADAWHCLAARPGRETLHHRLISSSAPVKMAATAMAAGFGLQHLVAVGPDGNQVVGVLSPLDLLRCYVNGQTEGSEKTKILYSQCNTEQPALVANVISQRVTAECRPDHTLAEACSVLISSNRTAAVVVDDDGSPLGVLTENDILQAFVDGMPWDCSVEQWLNGGEARLPSFLISALSIRPDLGLTEAAARMTVQTEGDFACHHLLVDDGQKARLLSALDIARGMAIAASEVSTAAQLLVSQAMKRRCNVPTCRLGESLADAFDILVGTRQNAVFVVPSCLSGGEPEVEDEQLINGSAVIAGVISPADAIRMFAQRMNCASVSLSTWLRRRGVSPEPRFISIDASLADAANLMMQEGVHHLLVQEPVRSKVVGVISALDIVRSIGALYMTPPCSSSLCSWNVASDSSPKRCVNTGIC